MLDDGQTVERAVPESTAPKRTHRIARKGNLHDAELLREAVAFEHRARDAFLRNTPKVALQLCGESLRRLVRHETFALMAMCFEATGDFNKADECKLLQAYLARDSFLWQELLGEYFGQEAVLQGDSVSTATIWS